MEDNDKDDNNFKDISSLGLDRDLGFSRGHQGHRPHDDDDDEDDDDDDDDGRRRRRTETTTTTTTTTKLS